MAKKKEQPIKVTKDFIDSSLFSSWRYYIGRSTIHSHCQAIDMVKFFIANPNLFSEDRMKFMGQDVRKTINESFGWNDHVFIDNSFYQNAGDAVSYLILGVKKFFEELGKEFDDKELKNIKFEVDAITGEVTWKTLEKDTYEFYLANRLSDYEAWIRLAGFLNPTHLITYTFDGKTETRPGFMQPTIYRDMEGKMNIEVNYCTVDGVKMNPSVMSHVASEYIDKVEKL